MKKAHLVILTLFISHLSLNAQSNVPCGTDEHHQHQVLANPAMVLAEEQANETALKMQYMAFKAGAVRYIPVVFHVVHNYGVENISQEQINDQIRILNEDFRKKAGTKGGASTNPLASDMEIEFRLAQYDPSGKPTDGVNRIQSTQSFNADDNLKALSYWPSDKYLNVWVVNFIKNTGNTGTLLGYAQFPWDRATQPTTDGIIVRADMVGAIGTASVNDGGRTLTHEIGHWLGLYHTFQNGCGNGQNCTTQGDRVCDTPPVANPNYGCVSSINSCSSEVPDLNDMVANYMDYADGSCMNLFTSGQLVRINSMLPTYRTSLYSTGNLSAAGINPDGSYPVFTSANKTLEMGFNVNGLAGTGWSSEAHTINPDTGWKLNSQVGHNDNSSIYVRNILSNIVGTRSSFSSPSTDISGFAAPTLSFYVAYAKRVSGSSDWLRIYVSDNYGRTEILVKTFIAGEMQTGTMNAAEFVPSGGTEWKALSVDLSPYKNYKNLSIRFEFVNRKGNNIYVDDIQIGAPLQTAGLPVTASDVNFFPNPASETGTVSFSLSADEEVAFELYDVCGKLVLSEEVAFYTSGQYQKEINLSSLGNGIYYLNLKTGSGTITRKVIVSH